MRLETPDKIRTLQRKLYCKAKAEPEFRFYLLYDKICREDILGHSYRLARANAGAPGVDGMTFAQIEAEGVDAWLASLREELAVKSLGTVTPISRPIATPLRLEIATCVRTGVGAMDKWPACATVESLAPAGHLSIA